MKFTGTSSPVLSSLATPTQCWRARAVCVPLLIAAAFGLATKPAAALDGCRALMCLASPDWSQLEECVPTVEAVFRRLAHDKPLPGCSTAGKKSQASNAWAEAPDNCPEQYTETLQVESTPTYRCRFVGVISVHIDDKLWTRTWWTPGDSVTEFSKRAKKQLGTWNSRFDDDQKAWLDAQEPAPSACDGDC